MGESISIVELQSSILHFAKAKEPKLKAMVRWMDLTCVESAMESNKLLFPTGFGRVFIFSIVL